MRRLLYSSLLMLMVFSTSLCIAQTVPVGSLGLEDYYRRQQLQGKGDSVTSFTVRPLFNSSEYKFNLYPDSGSLGYKRTSDFYYYKSKKSKLEVSFLPATFKTQFNSDHNYGWNNGPMIPSKGIETYYNAGFFLKYGILTVQISPEVVIAANNDFDTFNKNHYDVVTARYYDIYNNIDLPVRFGTGTYSRFYGGQSSIRLNYGSFSAGLSTENLWWGPGIRNSLLMSNSAPGFPHLTFNTTKPVKTKIGSFEGQFIAGRLEGSGYNPLDSGRTYFGTKLYVPKPTDWRYLSGFVVTWQPKWINGLFLGATASKQLYSKSINSLGDDLPFFNPFKKNIADQPINIPDTRSSMFARWVWPEEKAEVYFEYGINNNTNSFSNALLEPNDARAYIFGLRKMLPFNTSRGESILVSVEATQLAETNVSKVLSGAEWYVNPYVRDGYTNEGQSLGAGIGPGGNLQTLDVSWVKGFKNLGIRLERYVHNDDLYYYIFYDSGDYTRHWVDLSLALHGDWNYKNFIFNASINAIRSLNYQYFLKGNGADVFFQNGYNVTNIQLLAGVTYRF